MTIVAHTNVVKVVTWVKKDSLSHLLMSAPVDQTVLLWAEKSCWGCGVYSVGSSGTNFAVPLGIRCWWSGLQSLQIKKMKWKNQQISQERNRNQQLGLTRTPLVTFSGHTEIICSLLWSDSEEICSASLDHVVRVWDIEHRGLKPTLTGNKVFNCSLHSPHCKCLTPGSTDRCVRLWGPWTNDGSLVLLSFTSPTGWVTSVVSYPWTAAEFSLFRWHCKTVGNKKL